jgi:hypothetical protein
MKPFVTPLIVIVAITGLVALTWANPALLPKHDGYPMDRAVSPITGQSLANDPGKLNAIGEKALMQAAAAEDVHVSQSLMAPHDQRLFEKAGTGNMPPVENPDMAGDAQKDRRPMQ